MSKTITFLVKEIDEKRAEILVIDKNKNPYRVDPFVDEAWDWEKRDELIGKWFEAEGDWYIGKEKMFLPNSGEMKLITKNQIK